jgi:hypothetical protein
MRILFYLIITMLILVSCNSKITSLKSDLKRNVEKLNQIKKENSGFRSDVEVRSILLFQKPIIDKIISLEAQIDDYYNRNPKKPEYYYRYYNEKKIKDCCRYNNNFFVHVQLVHMATKVYVIEDAYK